MRRFLAQPPLERKVRTRSKMMQMVFSMPDESEGTKRRNASHRPITGVVNGTRPAIRLERVCESTLKAKTDQAGEVVGYKASDEHESSNVEHDRRPAASSQGVRVDGPVGPHTKE